MRLYKHDETATQMVEYYSVFSLIPYLKNTSSPELVYSNSGCV